MHGMSGDRATPPSKSGFWVKVAIAAMLTGMAVWLFVIGSWPGGLVVSLVALGWVARTLQAYRRWKHGDPLFPSA